MDDLTKGTLSILQLAAASNKFARNVGVSLFNTLVELFEKRDFPYQFGADGLIQEDFTSSIAIHQNEGRTDYIFYIEIVGNGTISICRTDETEDQEDRGFFFTEQDGVDKIVSDILVTIASLDEETFAPALLSEIRQAAAKKKHEAKINGESPQPPEQ